MSLLNLRELFAGFRQLQLVSIPFLFRMGFGEDRKPPPFSLGNLNDAFCMQLSPQSVVLIS